MYYEQSVHHKCLMCLNLYFSGCCYFLSSAINPFLYSLLSKRFRRGFHDLKYKLLRDCRLVSSRTSNSRLSYGRQQGTRPIMSMRNKQSFRFKSRQIPAQNTVNRLVDRPTTSYSENNTKSCHKRKESLEIEMFRVANEINSYWKYNSNPHSGTIPIEMIENKRDENEFNPNIENENPVELSSSQKQIPQTDCKYTGLFKPNSKDYNPCVARVKNRRKKTTQKRIPRCECMIDLRSVGSSLAMVRMNRSKSEILFPNIKLLSKAHSHTKKTFSIEMLSS